MLKWPAKSPDLNITEDVWKLLSDLIYDGPPYQNKASLAERIKNAITKVNQRKRNIIQNLYVGMRSLLCKVLIRQGRLCNK